MKKLMFVATIALSAIMFAGCAPKDAIAGDHSTAKAVFEPQQETTQDQTEEVVNFAEAESWEEQQALTNQVMETRPEGALQYEPKGIYNLEGFKDKSYKVYTFEGPNDFYEVMMLDEEEDSILIYHNSGEQGVSFQSTIYKGGKFKGLTENYILFEEDDSNITAVSIEEKDNCEIGEYLFNTVSLDDLTEKEKETAVYPNGYYMTISALEV